jgi:HSP20 family protein
MSELIPKRPWHPSPWRELETIENRLRRLLEDPLPSTEPVGWGPAVDLVETDDELQLTAELPGLDTRDVEIEVEDHVLTIRGEKKDESESEEEHGDHRVHVWERRYGEFARSFAIPTSVDVEKISAEVDRGVLTVHLPETKQARGRRIEVHAR